ncbi:hypothetical protein ACTFIZ_003610 [Dictyostelium cf. discoideum]
MKIFIKLFILINLFFINFIYSKEECSLFEPIFTFGQIGCENPKIEIENFRDYDNIIFEPIPISKSFALPNNFIVVLDFGINYQITFINDKCINNIYRTIQTKEGPRFKTTKGSCAGSKGLIEFIPDPEVSSIYYTLINGIPKDVPFYSKPGTFRVQANTDEGFSCENIIKIPDSNIQSEKKPQVKLTNPICENNGEIQVLNVNDYLSVSLQNKDSSQFYEQSSPGLFKSLGDDGFILTTIDNECGELQYIYYLMNDIPQYQLEIVDNTCPKSPLVKLTMNSSLPYNIEYYGETQTNPFIANNVYGYQIASSCGRIDFEVSLPKTYPPIQYIAEDVGHCKPYRITLLYDSNDFTNLQIFNKYDQIIELDQNKSFIAETDSLYYIKDPCYDDLVIGKTNPKPFLKYIKIGRLCSDLVDIQLLNWEDFSFIELKTYGDIGLKYSMEYGGIFKNVLYQKLIVDYRHNGCSDIQTTTFGEHNSFIYQSDIDFTLDIIEYPKCSFPRGQGNLTIYSKYTKELIGSKVRAFDYDPTSGTILFYFGELMYFCYVSNLELPVDNIKLPEPVVTIRTIANSTCKLPDIAGKNVGKVKFESSEHVYKIIVNGSEFLYRPDLILDLYYGNSNLTFIFEGICQQQTYTHFVDSNDDFALSFEIVNVTDCSQPNGALLIHNWDQLENLNVKFINDNNFPEYFPNSEHWYSNLPSGQYEITIEKVNADGSSCSGRSIILIPTSLEVDVSYSIVNKPICNEDDSGSISFDYVTFRDQTTMTINNVIYSGFFENGMAYGLTPGDYNFNIISGSCSWTKPVTMPMEPISYTYETLWYYRSDSCSIEFGYQFNFDNYLVGDVTIPIYYQHIYNNGLLSGSSQYSFGVPFIVKNVCEFIFPINIDESILYPKISYTITRNPVCHTGEETFDIQISNPSDWFPLIVGNKSMDSNGIVKNVQQNSIGYGLQKNSNCAAGFRLSELVDDNLVIDKQTKDEICLGSKTGELLLTDDEYNYYPFINSEVYGEQVLLPLLNSEERNKFYDISSEDVTIEMIRKDRSKLLSTCKQYDKFTLTGIEPTLIDISNDQCSIDGFGSIQVVPSVEGLEYQANLIYNGKEEMLTNKLDNVKPGEYIIESYRITTDYCKRTFTQVSVDIGVSIFSLNISSNSCESVIIAPSILNSTFSSDLLYNYNITTPSNVSMQFIKSGVLTVDSLKEIGQYDLTVSDGHCTQNHKFSISQCQLDNSDDGTTNIGLAVGLPIGLVAAGATAAGVFFYKKRVGSIKTKELLPEEHEMETVTTFQGVGLYFKIFKIKKNKNINNNNSNNNNQKLKQTGTTNGNNFNNTTNINTNNINRNFNNNNYNNNNTNSYNTITNNTTTTKINNNINNINNNNNNINNNINNSNGNTTTPETTPNLSSQNQPLQPLFYVKSKREFCEIIEPLLHFEDTHCDSDYYSVVNPTVYIENIKDYDRILISPEPISRTYNAPNNYIVVLDFGKSYNFQFVNDKCAESPPVEIITKNGPRFIITDPPCIGSTSTINFIPDPELTGVVYTFAMNSSSITLPIQLDAPNQYIIEAFFDGVSKCKEPITLKGSNNPGVQPKIKTKNPVCGELNGVIEIENYNNFTSIVIGSSAPIQPTNAGVYSELSGGQYTITTIDPECGERSISVPLNQVVPSYQVEFVDFSCPTSPKIQLVINTTQNYQIFKGDEPVSNPFTTAYYDAFSVELECGVSFNLVLNLPDSFPLLQYTYEESDYCQPYTINIIGYNSSLYPALSVYQEDSTIELDANHSFVATTGKVYLLQDNCYNSVLPIGRTYPKPIYNYLNNSDSCVDTVDIQIYNSEDFYYISLMPYQGEGGVSPKIYSIDEGGVFRNVTNQKLYLEYSYRGCSDTYGFEIGNMNRMDNNNLDVQYNITRYPTCYYLFGEADVKFYKKNTTELVASFTQSFYYYGEGAFFGFYTDFEYNCFGSVNGLDLGDFKLEQPRVNVTTETQPTCRYAQNDGTIRIDSNTEITTFKINGANVSPFNNNGLTYYFNCNTGNITIELTFSRQTECNQITIYHMVEPKQDFSLSYQTNNVTDCTQMDGSIFIDGWDTFTSLSIDGSSYVPGPDFWLVDLKSKEYLIEFVKTFDDGSTCTGTEYIFVPSLPADISYTIINQPLCSDDQTGTVSFEYASNFPNQPNRMPIQYVSHGGILIKGTIAENFYPGTYLFSVSYGTCSWGVPVTFNEIPIDITYKQVWNYLDETCQIQVGYQFSANNSIAAGNIAPYYYDFTSVGGLLFGKVTSYSVNVDVYYAPYQACKKTFEFLFDDYNALRYPQVYYTIIRKPDCMSADHTYDIKITDPSKWASVTVGGMSMDSNGIIKNVVPYMKIEGITLGTNCIHSSLYRDEEYNEIAIESIVTDETCHGSKNGQIQFPDDQYDYYVFSMDKRVLLPLANPQDKYTFKQITSEYVDIGRVGKNILKSTCMPFANTSIQGNEPTLIENINDQCTADGLGSINYETSIQGLNVMGIIYLNDTSEQQFNGTFNDITPGSYRVVNLRVTNDNCLRRFDSLDVNVGSSIFSININSSICESVIITPLSITSSYPNAIYQYDITSPTNKSQQYIQPDLLKLDSFEEFGLYTVVVSDIHCIQTQVFNITKCLKPIDGSDDDDDGVNLGLAIGLPIGLVSLGAIIAASIFLYRKRQSPIKANELPPLSHEMETVSTFQGGRVVEIDKF